MSLLIVNRMLQRQAADERTDSDECDMQHRLMQAREVERYFDAYEGDDEGREPEEFSHGVGGFISFGSQSFPQLSHVTCRRQPRPVSRSTFTVKLASQQLDLSWDSFCLSWWVFMD